MHHIAEGTDRLLAARASRPRRRPARATVAELVGQLSARDHGLARVLLRCSYLCDGIAIRDPSSVSARARPWTCHPFCGRMIVIYVTSRNDYEMATGR